jgi:hypothetical protein
MSLKLKLIPTEPQANIVNFDKEKFGLSSTFILIFSNSLKFIEEEGVHFNIFFVSQTAKFHNWVSLHELSIHIFFNLKFIQLLFVYDTKFLK